MIYSKTIFRQLVMATIVIVLIGGYAVTPSYAKIVKFETPFETSAIPLCSLEEVVFSGVAKFRVSEDINGKLSAHMVYYQTRGTGITSGTEYIVHENDRETLQTEEDGDVILRTVSKGSFVAQGKEINTLVSILTVTVIHSNGDAETIVDEIEIKCNGQ